MLMRTSAPPAPTLDSLALRQGLSSAFICAHLRQDIFQLLDLRSVARRISIRNGIQQRFSPVKMRLVAAAQIEAFFLYTSE
jgi:hypothetical protein